MPLNWDIVSQELWGNASLIITELVVSGFNAYLIYGALKTCRRDGVAADALRRADYLSVDSDLVEKIESSPEKTLEYAAIKGRVKEYLYPPFPASSQGLPCFIRQTRNTEILAKRSWDFSTKYSQGKPYDTLEFRPFSLQSLTDTPISFSFDPQFEGAKAGCFPTVVIKEISLPETSDLLKQCSQDYYEQIQGTDYNPLTIVFEYLFGIRTLTSIHKTEKLLPVNEIITAVGRVVKTGDLEYTVEAPKNIDLPYMLTTKSFEDVVDEHSVRKFSSYLFLITVTGAGFLVLWDLAKRLKLLYNKLYNDANPDSDSTGSGRNGSARTRMMSDLCDDGDCSGSGSGDNLCVICQTQRRNVVLMNCKHFCLCEGCLSIMNRRQNRGSVCCPVCRQPIVGTMKVFVS